MPDDTESSNLRQTERLNQRGGRTLSVVDLLRAGTLTTEMAAVGGAAIALGASIITGAVPSGAGKTALMASLLGFLAPGREILTVEAAQDLTRPESGNREPVYLVHEIGSGPWYGYLWGTAVSAFIAKASGQGSLASCLHADTVDEARAILASPALGVAEEDLDRVELFLFIRRDRRGHRVSTMNVPAPGGGHACLYQWEESAGTHLRAGHETALGPLVELLGATPGEFDELAEGLAAFLTDLLDSDVRAYEEIRSRFLESGLK